MTAPILINPRTRYSPHSELFGSPQRARKLRCTVVVAHPNDEIVGGGCLISKIAPLNVVHMSDGAPPELSQSQSYRFGSRSNYANLRRTEGVAALELANVDPRRVIEWGIPQFELSFQLVDLSKRLMDLFRETSPEIVLTHAYEGGHPDHDATAFAVHAAVRAIRRNGLKPPLIYEMAIYPGNHGSTKVPEFLLNAARESTTLVLDQTSADLKQRMFDCFETQRDVLTKTPLGPEKFRESPNYDFRLPPYFGKLHYERLDWGMTGKKWRSLARQALRTLFPEALAAPYILRPQSRVIASATDRRAG